MIANSEAGLARPNNLVHAGYTLPFASRRAASRRPKCHEPNDPWRCHRHRRRRRRVGQPNLRICCGAKIQHSLEYAPKRGSSRRFRSLDRCAKLNCSNKRTGGLPPHNMDNVHLSLLLASLRTLAASAQTIAAATLAEVPLKLARGVGVSVAAQGSRLNDADILESASPRRFPIQCSDGRVFLRSGASRAFTHSVPPSPLGSTDAVPQHTAGRRIESATRIAAYMSDVARCFGDTRLPGIARFEREAAEPKQEREAEHRDLAADGLPPAFRGTYPGREIPGALDATMKPHAE